jgi:hypothetical protein
MTEREEQAVVVLNTLHDNPLLSDIHRQALEVGIMAIKALSRSEKPNTCGDAISRQGLLNRLDDFNKWCKDGRLQGSLFAVDVIKDMPSVTPQQKTGRWIGADVFDKIRAEIADLDDADYDYEGYYNAVTDVLQIIDKYKAESEDKE